MKRYMSCLKWLTDNNSLVERKFYTGLELHEVYLRDTLNDDDKSSNSNSANSGTNTDKNK